MRAYGFVSAKEPSSDAAWWPRALGSGDLFGLARSGTLNSSHEPDNTLALSEHVSLSLVTDGAGPSKSP